MDIQGVVKALAVLIKYQDCDSKELTRKLKTVFNFVEYLLHDLTASVPFQLKENQKIVLALLSNEPCQPCHNETNSQKVDMHLSKRFLTPEPHCTKPEKSRR